MSLKDAFLRTRQAALDIAVERARPAAWKAGRTEQDGVTTVTTGPVAADAPDGTPTPDPDPSQHSRPPADGQHPPV